MSGRLAAWLPLLPVAAVLAFGACGGGACGEAPAESKSAPPSGGGIGGGAHGSGDVNLSEWDGRKRDQAAPKQAAPAPQPSVAAAAPTQASANAMDVVTKADWKAKVATASGRVLVIVSRAGCAECALVSPIFSAIAADTPDWKLYQLDAAAAGARSLLPKGMPADPPPGFVIYDKGWARSRQQGLPFARGKGESDAVYQARLSNWFRAALAQESFTFVKR